MSVPSDFAVFILTNSRPDRVKTFTTLRESGYTGPIYLIVDSLDKTVGDYRKQFGADSVKVFDKLASAKTFDVGDNFNDLRSVIFSRNASFDIALELGIKYFVQLDDDYGAFEFRFGRKGYRALKTRALDEVFSSVLNFYKSTPLIKTIALSQGGDFIGGSECKHAESVMLLRKAMNSFFCSTERRFNFIGLMNDDVNTYVSLGSRGEPFFTMNQLSLVQTQTQTNGGGLSTLYVAKGTYVKSMYTVMMMPSCTKISMMGGSNLRIHHQISWNNAAPLILRENLRKASNGKKA